MPPGAAISTKINYSISNKKMNTLSIDEDHILRYITIVEDEMIEEELLIVDSPTQSSET